MIPDNTCIMYLLVAEVILRDRGSVVMYITPTRVQGYMTPNGRG